MFIKKDLRRIDEILPSEDDDKSVLKFSKRGSEFQGNISIFFEGKHLDMMKDVQKINLYDNLLTSVDGIGQFKQLSRLRELNLGNNQLTSLPSEISLLQSLEVLWLDDNQLEEFPTALCRLNNLKELRLSGNSIPEIPDIIQLLQKLELLAVDNNQLCELAPGLFKIKALKSLWLRQNQLTELPEAIIDLEHLEVLSMSSNKLSQLPNGLSSLTKLRCFYANGNRIDLLPEDFTDFASLQELNLSNNLITQIPTNWQGKIQPLHPESGQFTIQFQSSCKIFFFNNPVKLM